MVIVVPWLSALHAVLCLSDLDANSDGFFFASGHVLCLGITFFLSLVFKELLHQLAALVFKDAGGDGATGVQGMRGIGRKAALLITTTIDDAWYLAPAEGSGTHRTGLYCDVEGTVGEVFATQFIGSHRDSLHLSVGGHVVQCLCQVMGTRYDAVLANDDGTNGYLALVVGGLRLLQGTAHILIVLIFFFHDAKVRKKSRNFAK